MNINFEYKISKRNAGPSTMTGVVRRGMSLEHFYNDRTESGERQCCKDDDTESTPALAQHKQTRSCGDDAGASPTDAVQSSAPTSQHEISALQQENLRL